jgi:hypothetical protein
VTGIAVPVSSGTVNEVSRFHPGTAPRIQWDMNDGMHSTGTENRRCSTYEGLLHSMQVHWKLHGIAVGQMEKQPHPSQEKVARIGMIML